MAFVCTDNSLNGLSIVAEGVRVIGFARVKKIMP
jgi:hypothetical protein